MNKIQRLGLHAWNNLNFLQAVCRIQPDPVEAAEPLEDLMETEEFPQCCHSSSRSGCSEQSTVCTSPSCASVLAGPLELSSRSHKGALWQGLVGGQSSSRSQPKHPGGNPGILLLRQSFIFHGSWQKELSNFPQNFHLEENLTNCCLSQFQIWMKR